MPQRKTCNGCNNTYPPSMFYKVKRGTFGVGCTCKDCIRVKRRLKYRENPEAKLRCNRNWLKNNPEKEKIFKKQDMMTPRAIWSRIKTGCRNRRTHIPFAISKEEFKHWYVNKEKICEYCRMPWPELENIVDRLNNSTFRLSIDRINTSKGYTIENICLCCMRCNDIKSDFFSYEQMTEIGKIVREIWQERNKEGQTSLADQLRLRLA